MSETEQKKCVLVIWLSLNIVKYRKLAILEWQLKSDSYRKTKTTTTMEAIAGEPLPHSITYPQTVRSAKDKKTCKYSLLKKKGTEPPSLICSSTQQTAIFGSRSSVNTTKVIEN